MPDPGHPDLGPIHHFAYVVEAIEPAARRLHEQFGAGPFFHLEEVPVEDVTSGGEPAVFKHGSAFGICNGVPVELMEIAQIEPQRADERFRGSADGAPATRHGTLGRAVQHHRLRGAGQLSSRGATRTARHSHSRRRSTSSSPRRR